MPCQTSIRAAIQQLRTPQWSFTNHPGKVSGILSTPQTLVLSFVKDVQQGIKASQLCTAQHSTAQHDDLPPHCRLAMC